MKDFSELQESVLKKGLCTRCGCCVGICPVRAIGLDEDRYPVLEGRCTSCGFCSRSCPGGDADLPSLGRRLFGEQYSQDSASGYCEKISIAHAADNEIREKGTSGGVVTALLSFMLKEQMIDGAVVVGMDEKNPYLTRGRLACSLDEIKSATQSKYCITPSLEALGEIRKRKGKFAVVGLPCQVQAVRKLKEVDPALSKKIFCVLGLHCHYTMNPGAHIEALKACHVALDDIAWFNFRGGGWPGGFQVLKKDGSQFLLHKTRYTNILNIMFRLYSPHRCYMCYDAVAEFADVSFGDFWAFDYKRYSHLENCTLVSQRTRIGAHILAEAFRKGALKSWELPKESYPKRTVNTVREKRSIARVKIIRNRTKGLPVPDYHITLQTPTRAAELEELSYRVFELMRNRFMRTILLRLLFSPVGTFFFTLNNIRKKAIRRYVNRE